MCIFHVLHDQWRPLLTSAYLWYLLILAVGGMVAAGFYDPLQAHNGIKVLVPLVQVCVCHLFFPHPCFPHPCFPTLSLIFSPLLLFSPSHLLLPFFPPFSSPFPPSPLPPSPIFLLQSLRLPRLLRLFPAVKKFFLKILGDGTRLFVVILMTLIFLVWFAVINMQLFGYLRPELGCRNFDNQFSGLTSVRTSLIPRAFPDFAR